MQRPVISQRIWPITSSTLLYLFGVLVSLTASVGVAQFEYARYAVEGNSNWIKSGSTDELLLVSIFFGVLIGWGSVFWRHSHPELAIIAGAFLTIVLQLDYLLLAIGLSYWIGRNRGHWRWQVCVGGLAVMIFAIIRNMFRSPYASEAVIFSGTQLPSRSLIIGTSLTFGLATMAVSLTTGFLAASKRDQARAAAEAIEIRQGNATLRNLLSGHEQREDFSKEVHDSLAHRLSLLSLRSQSLSDELKTSDPQHAAAASELRRLTLQSLEDLRGLVQRLNADTSKVSSMVPNEVSLAAVPKLIQESIEAGVEIDHHVLLTQPETISPQIGIVAFRVVQEAMTNSIKHGSGALTVTVIGAPISGVIIDVRNSLAKTNVAAASGARSGINGMRERVATVGGQFSYQVTDHQFIVTVSLPWQGCP